MHEQLAIDALIERLSCLEHVAEVRVRASVVFSPEALEQAYAMRTCGGPLVGSRIVVEPRTEERACAGCGRAWTISAEDVVGHLVLCPACGHAVPLGDGAVLEVTGLTWGPPPGPA